MNNYFCLQGPRRAPPGERKVQAAPAHPGGGHVKKELRLTVEM